MATTTTNKTPSLPGASFGSGSAVTAAAAAVAAAAAPVNPLATLQRIVSSTQSLPGNPSLSSILQPSIAAFTSLDQIRTRFTQIATTMLIESSLFINGLEHTIVEIEFYLQVRKKSKRKKERKVPDPIISSLCRIHFTTMDLLIVMNCKARLDIGISTKLEKATREEHIKDWTLHLEMAEHMAEF